MYIYIALLSLHNKFFFWNANHTSISVWYYEDIDTKSLGLIQLLIIGTISSEWQLVYIIPFLHDFLEILKRSLQNLLKILKTCFLCVCSRSFYGTYHCQWPVSRHLHPVCWCHSHPYHRLSPCIHLRRLCFLETRPSCSPFSIVCEHWRTRWTP